MTDTTNTRGEPKPCASCGSLFGCGAKLDGCWCSDIYLPGEIAADLKTKYQDCLCPKCLQSALGAPAVIVTYPDGSIEIVPEAVRVDTQNYHEGMFDFYDDRGNLLRQINMSSGASWEEIGGSAG